VTPTPKSSLDGWTVRRFCISFRVDLVLAEFARSDAAEALVSFTGEVQLIAGSDTQVLDIEGPKEGLGRLLATYGMTVSTCTVSADGTLLIALEDGWALRCSPHPSYEAWELRTPTEYIVCQPGGELSVWSLDADSGQPPLSR
jgi:hypothetical protein